MYDDGGYIGFDAIEKANRWANAGLGWNERGIVSVVDTQAPLVPVSPANDVEDKEAGFYIIWCPESDKPPRNKFHLSQAIKVVASMRAKFPGQTFHIMAKVDE